MFENITQGAFYARELIDKDSSFFKGGKKMKKLLFILMLMPLLLMAQPENLYFDDSLSHLPFQMTGVEMLVYYELFEEDSLFVIFPEKKNDDDVMALVDMIVLYKKVEFKKPTFLGFYTWLKSKKTETNEQKEVELIRVETLWQKY